MTGKYPIKKYLSKAMLMLGCVLMLTLIVLFSDKFTPISKATLSGTTGDCVWEIKDEVLTISGNGPMGNGSPYKNYSIKKVVIKEGVTSVGNHAFAYYCSDVENVRIPNSVTSIGEGAFEDCGSLTSITIPDSVVSIGNSAFRYCRSLVSITIPSGVTCIDPSVFYNCTGLEMINVAKSNPIYHSDENCIIESETNNLVVGCKNSVIPDYITRIGNDAFRYCEDLMSISIPDSVTSIGACAFEDCIGLSDITISAGVIRLSASAFTGCINLNKINVAKNNVVYHSNGNCLIESESNTLVLGCKNSIIPDYVTSINNGAFEECSNLTSIIIPNSVTSIGNRAFMYCTGLKSVAIADSVTSIGDEAFYQCSGLTEIVLPARIKSIGSSVFQFCGNLTSITLPEGLISIGNNAFYMCYNLSSIVIPKDVTIIGKRAFYRCWGLKSITMPVSVTNIGYSAFEDCTNLRNVWYQGGEKEKAYIEIDYLNKCLSDAIWYYNTCKVEHTYLHGCDSTCENCDWIRQVRNNISDDHIFSLNNGLTCEYCGYSKQPSKPILEKRTSNLITLVIGEGLEYSKDGEVWQDSNVFAELSPNTTYTFYQRVKASTGTLLSEKSEGLTVCTKDIQIKPSAPTILNYTDTTVTLNIISNGEYSCDGLTWQTSNVFTGLSAGTEYIFYQRYVETDTHEVSDKSLGTSVTTDKSKQSLIPDAPTIQSFTSSSITLVTINGCEYSKDGTTWQSSSVFSGLSCGTEYDFYQRYKETTSTYAGQSSAPTHVKTDKGAQDALPMPTLSSKTQNSVTLTLVSGYEYSMDGIHWQTSNVFSGLNPDTNYQFCQRRAETPTHYAGEASNYLLVRTNAIPKLPTGTWKHDGIGWWYQNADGTYPASCWKEIDNVWYYFNASGYIVTGWQSIGGTWYYFAGSGAMVTGWQSISGTWYYFVASGAMVTGWQSIGGTWYYFAGSGAMVTGWQSIGGTWYYFAGSGAMVTGWQSIGGTWYYFAGSGAMVTGWQSIGGTWYYFEGSGAMVANRWVGNYYLQADGSMATNKWIGNYYVGADGVWVP